MEWCWDFYGAYPMPNPGAAVIDPQGPPTGSAGHVLRGGNYLLGGSFCRSASRFSAAALSPPFGFRVVLAPINKGRFTCCGLLSAVEKGRRQPFQ